MHALRGFLQRKLSGQTDLVISKVRSINKSRFLSWPAGTVGATMSWLGQWRVIGCLDVKKVEELATRFSSDTSFLLFRAVDPLPLLRLSLRSLFQALRQVDAICNKCWRFLNFKVTPRVH